MALQMSLDSLDGVDESTQKLYVQKDGKYLLDVEGLPDNKDKVSKNLLDQEIEKRKQYETSLNEIAESLIQDVPEDKRSIVPDLPPNQKIAWLRTALKMGFFNEKQIDSIDSKRPGAKPPDNFTGMSPQAIMATGYKTK